APHLAAVTRELTDRSFGVYHVAAEGDCTWAELAEALFAEAGLDCRVRPITTDELGRRAARPAYSVLRSEKDAPRLPHWREGLGACLGSLRWLVELRPGAGVSHRSCVKRHCGREEQTARRERGRQRHDAPDCSDSGPACDLPDRIGLTRQRVDGRAD